MGWDVSILRVNRDAVKVLPRAGGIDDVLLRDVSAAATEDLVRRLPSVRPNGATRGEYVWLGNDREGLMELSISEASVFVGHAKLEPLLALHASLEAARPGWLLLDVGSYTLHDAESLRREHQRRQDVAIALRQKLGL